MSKYINEKVINYPVREVFKIFKTTAKRDFTKFDEKNPVGSKVQRQVGGYANKAAKMEIEVTAYKPNELYEIKSTHGMREYTSRYELYPVGEDKTRIVQIESAESAYSIKFINAILAVLFFNRKVRKRFNTLVEGLEVEIENNLKRMERSKPKG
jgi:hypothetical protein